MCKTALVIGTILLLLLLLPNIELKQLLPQADAHTTIALGTGGTFGGGSYTAEVPIGGTEDITVCVGSQAGVGRTVYAGDLIDPNGNHFASSHKPIFLPLDSCHRYLIDGSRSDYPTLGSLSTVGTYHVDFTYDPRSDGNVVLALPVSFDVIQPTQAYLVVDPGVLTTGQSAQIKFCTTRIGVDIIDAEVADPSGALFSDRFDEINVPAGQCFIWNTDDDFPGFSTNQAGGYLARLYTDDGGLLVINFAVGFFVVPESPIGVLAMTLSSLAALGGFAYFRKARA